MWNGSWRHSVRCFRLADLVRCRWRLAVSALAWARAFTHGNWRAAGGLACSSALVCGCIVQPSAPATAALYRDLRTIVDAGEYDGWSVDRLRVQANSEPALHSVCRAESPVRADLQRWLGAEMERHGGSAEQLYHANGGDLEAVASLLSLERTRALLDYAETRVAAHDCPFWWAPERTYHAVQGEAQRWVVLAETQAFASYVLDSHVPSLGGGGRLFAGYGISDQLTLAIGGDLAAGGTFIPTEGHGLDATLAVAVPVLLRLTRFSRIFDVELAPSARFSPGQKPLPPGLRVELGAGFSSVRLTPLKPYFMLYAGYEYHFATQAAGADSTIQAGTRLAFDWTP